MKKVNKIQERYLRLLTNNYELSHEELLDLINEISPHQRCLNFLMTVVVVYKLLNGFSPDTMKDILAVSKHLYHIRHDNLYVTDRPKTDRYGRNSIPYRANQIWNLLSRQTKKFSKLGCF